MEYNSELMKKLKVSTPAPEDAGFHVFHSFSLIFSLSLSLSLQVPTIYLGISFNFISKLPQRFIIAISPMTQGEPFFHSVFSWWLNVIEFILIFSLPSDLVCITSRISGTKDWGENTAPIWLPSNFWKAGWTLKIYPISGWLSRWKKVLK